MINFFEKLLSIIYIQSCYFCGSTKEDTIFCSKCMSKISCLPPDVLTKIDGCEVYSSATYDGVVTGLIKELKYNNKKRLAYYQAKIMYEYWSELRKEGKYIILPVPIHKNRRKERHYNHMDLVADEFAKMSGYGVNKKFLIRQKDTEKQYKLKRQARKENIKGAFIADNRYMPEQSLKILILDDITSTGATLGEIIKVLKECGYRDITALTLATPDIWN